MKRIRIYYILADILMTIALGAGFVSIGHSYYTVICFDMGDAGACRQLNDQVFEYTYYTTKSKNASSEAFLRDFDVNKWSDQFYQCQSSRNIPCPYFNDETKDLYCNIAFNRHAFDVKGEIPDDMVLFFQSISGWNLSGGSELVKTGQNRDAFRVHYGNGISEVVRTIDANLLRWKQDDVARKFPARGISPELTMPVLVGAIILTIIILSVFYRDLRKNMVLLIIFTMGSTVVGYILGIISETMYLSDCGSNRIIYILISFVLGLLYVSLMCRLFNEPKDKQKIFSIAVPFAIVVYVIYATVVHVLLMQAHSIDTFESLLNLGYASFAGSLLGMVATSFLYRPSFFRTQ